MGAIDTRPDGLGVKISGSARTGHQVELTDRDALARIFGTDDDQAGDLLRHSLRALMPDEATDEHPGADERGFVLSMIRDLAPRDAVERMLAVQMVAVHLATVRSGQWLAGAKTIPQAQTHYGGFNRLTRTFAAQVEALRKHRTGGEQRVTVQHQHINIADGAQAVVGTVQHRGRGGDG